MASNCCGEMLATRGMELTCAQNEQDSGGLNNSMLTLGFSIVHCV